MSTMHRNSNNTSSPWSSPKDNPLKRRHTRGNTSHSHSSIRSLSLSPAVSSVSLSDVNHVKSSPGFKPNNNNSRSQQQQQQQQPHSTRRRETDFQHHDFSHHELNSSYHDFHHHRDDKNNNNNSNNNNNEDYHKPSMKSGHQGGAGAAGFVPSWFGSLRSFAISATSSSRGAFTPLNTSSSSFSSSSSSSTTSSPTTSSSSKLHSKKSRGRSSSIYYSSTLHLHDDSDDDSDSGSSSGGGSGSGSGGSQDEPITDLNGLKENRVRGPRVNWMALDPSLGSLFAGTGGGGTYKPLSTNESDPDLSSSGYEEGEEKGFNCGHGGVEDLDISEAPYRDDQEEEGEGGDEGLGGGGCGGSGSGIDRASSRARAWSKGISGDADYRDDNNNAKEGAWARAMDDSNVPEVGFTMPVTAPSSTLAFLKSYVPSLGGGGGGASSDSSTITTSPTTTSPTTTSVTASQTSPAAVSGGGFWSLRKMSMNFLSGNQYASVGDKAANQCDDDDEEGNESEDQHRPREQGRRTGYRDDYNDHGDNDGGRRELPQRQGDSLSKEMRSTTTTMTMPPSPVSGGGVTVSYLASMVQNATQAGAQYIPVQVRDQLPVSSRSLKKD